MVVGVIIFFFISKVLGASCLTRTFKPCSKFVTLYNFTLCAIYVFLLFHAIKTAHPDDVFGIKNYSFISQINYCIQLYGSSMLVVIIMIYQAIYKEEQSKCVLLLSGLNEELVDLGLMQKQLFYTKFLTFNARFFIVLLFLLIMDVIQCPQDISLELWICLYYPGIFINVHITGLLSYLGFFETIAQSINKTISKHCYLEAKFTDLWDLRKSNITPIELLRKMPKSDSCLLDKVCNC